MRQLRVKRHIQEYQTYVEIFCSRLKRLFEVEKDIQLSNYLEMVTTLCMFTAIRMANNGPLFRKFECFKKVLVKISLDVL